MKVAVVPIVISAREMVSKHLERWTEKVEIWKRIDTFEYRIIESSQNGVTQIPMKDYQLILVWKIIKEYDFVNKNANLKNTQRNS